MSLGYTMKMVSQETGLTPYVIRAWEKRYGVTNPERTKTNRRIYNDQDVQKLTLLRQLTEKGYTIGRIANEDIGTLRSMAAGLAGGSPGSGSVDMEQADSLITRAMGAVQQLDGATLKEILRQASIRFSKPHLIREFIYPLMNSVGDRWEEGSMRVVHEHLCAAEVRGFLAGQMSVLAVPANAPILLVGTPKGHLHEIGALTVGLTAAMSGWRVMYLGPDVPAEEIAAGVLQLNAKAVALSIGYPAADAETIREFRVLREALPDLKIMVGGRVISSYRPALTGMGITCLNSLSDLTTELKRL